MIHLRRGLHQSVAGSIFDQSAEKSAAALTSSPSWVREMDNHARKSDRRHYLELGEGSLCLGTPVAIYSVCTAAFDPHATSVCMSRKPFFPPPVTNDQMG